MTESPRERQAHDHRIVQELLDERQQLWKLFQALEQDAVGHRPALETRLREFSQVLVDYISLGHFEVYPRLTEAPVRLAQVQALANTLYPQFTEATDAALDFNDRYEKLAGAALAATLPSDLARLGEALTLRFSLEDQLIGAMSR